MKKEVKNFERKDIFDYYNERSNPFIMLTTKVDITNVFKYCEKHGNYYATLTYVISLVVNEMDCFKYLGEGGKIYKQDVLNPSFTATFSDGQIGFFTCHYNKNYHEFINEYNVTKQRFTEQHTSIKYEDEGEFWVSCTPWFTFSSVIPPFDKSITIPQFVWGKFYGEQKSVYTDLMIMIHHGFADGRHVGEFLEKLNDKINRFNEIVK